MSFQAFCKSGEIRFEAITEELTSSITLKVLLSFECISPVCTSFIIQENERATVPGRFEPAFGMFLKSLRKVFGISVVESIILITLEHIGVVHTEQNLAISLGRPR